MTYECSKYTDNSDKSSRLHYYDQYILYRLIKRKAQTTLSAYNDFLQIVSEMSYTLTSTPLKLHLTRSSYRYMT